MVNYLLIQKIPKNKDDLDHFVQDLKKKSHNHHSRKQAQWHTDFTDLVVDLIEKHSTIEIDETKKNKKRSSMQLKAKQERFKQEIFQRAQREKIDFQNWPK